MPRTLKLPLVVCALAALLSLCAGVAAQQPSTNADDFERGNQLLARGDAKGARKSFEKREAALASLKARMRATAERLVATAGSPSNSAPPQEALELADTLRVYGSVPGGQPAQVFRQAEVTTKAVIHNKPEPSFAVESGMGKSSGVVRLRAVLAADGRVKNILVIKGLPDGLTEKAIATARQIRFTPATINARPVSQYFILEYNFNVEFRYGRTPPQVTMPRNPRVLPLPSPNRP